MKKWVSFVNAPGLLSLVLLVCLSCLLYLVNLGAEGVFAHDDDALYSRIAEEMFLKSEWWVPTWFGEYAFYKPPLMYWLIMICYRLFGVSSFAARLPSALSAIGTVILAWSICNSLFRNPRAALIAGFMAATSYGIIAYGRTAYMDLFLTFLITLCIWFFMKAHHTGSVWHRAGYFFFFGASSLIKGPMSCIILFSICTSYLLLYRRKETHFPRWIGCSLLSVVLFNALWPAALCTRGLFQEWLSFFIVRENGGKFNYDINYSPLTLLRFLFYYLIPWTAFFIVAAVEVVRKKLYADSRTGLLLLWISITFIFFCLPGIRLKWYVLPIIPAASILAGHMIAEYSSVSSMRIARLFTAVFISVIAVLSFFLFRMLPRAALFAEAAILVLLCVSVIGLLRRHAIVVSLVAVSMSLVLALYIFPIVECDLFPPRAISALSGQEFGVVGYVSYVFAWKSGKEVVSVHSSRFANDLLKEKKMVVIPAGILEEFRSSREEPLIPAEIICSWNYWKRRVSVGDVLSAMRQCSLKSVQEPHYIIRNCSGGGTTESTEGKHPPSLRSGGGQRTQR